MAVAGGVVFTWYGRETRGRCLWDLCLKHLANISGLWRLLPALWEQTTAEGWLPKKHLLPGEGGLGKPQQLCQGYRGWGCCGEGTGL